MELHRRTQQATVIEHTMLSKDRERTVKSSEAFVRLAMTQLMLNRLKPKGNQAEFHYRTAA
jgi:putative transposase